jgi:two-component system OmpR family response regulator
MKILLIEDDPGLAQHIVTSLNERGHAIETCAAGVEGLALAHTNAHALLIVERDLPDMDGLGLVKQLRMDGVNIPVLFLSARASVADRVEALEGGGDDYLVKPFAFEELAARVQVLSRRTTTPAGGEAAILKAGVLQMDLIRREVTCDGKPVLLQAQEFKLLEYLARNADRIVPRSTLLQNVWGLNFEPQTNIIETHMSRLRNKLPLSYRKRLILTIRGAGYILKTH